jgi:hypothetical protein
MRRIEERQIPAEFENIPLPESWSRETLDTAWDDTAGRRRFAAETTPRQPAPGPTSRRDLAQNVLQRDDADLRARGLQEILELLAADAPENMQLRGLATLRECLPAKFDRAPFRDRVLPMLQSDNPDIRARALMCLPGLDGDAADVPAVAPLAKDPSSEVRKQVGNALIQLGKGERADVVIPALTKLLHDKDSEVIKRTIRAMWGQYSSPEFDDLLVRISREERYSGLVIYHGLSTMRQKSPVVCRRLVAELDNPDWNDSGRAAWGLTYGVADDAKAFVEEGLLRALPQETHEYTREQEFRALKNIASSKSRDYLERVAESDLETEKFKTIARDILERLGQNS